MSHCKSVKLNLDGSAVMVRVVSHGLTVTRLLCNLILNSYLFHIFIILLLFPTLLPLVVQNDRAFRPYAMVTVGTDGVDFEVDGRRDDVALLVHQAVIIVVGVVFEAIGSFVYHVAVLVVLAGFVGELVHSGVVARVDDVAVVVEHLNDMVEAMRVDAAVVMDDVDFFVVDGQQRLALCVKQSVVAFVVCGAPEAFRFVDDNVIVGCDHPVAFTVDEAEAAVVGLHGAEASVETIVEVSFVGERLVDDGLAAVVDDAQCALAHHAGEAFGEDPSLFILRWDGHLSREAIEIASLLTVGEKGEAVAVWRCADEVDVGHRSASDAGVVKIARVVVVVDDVRADILVAVGVAIGRVFLAPVVSDA